MPQFDARLAERLDRLDIQDLLTRYGVAIDSRRWDMLDDVFTIDALIDYSSSGAPRGEYPAIRAWLESFLTKFPMNQHMTINSQIEVTGDRATGRSYFFNPNSFPDGSGVPQMMFVGGYYNDEFVRTADGWRIARREGETTWMYSDDPPEVWAERTAL